MYRGPDVSCHSPGAMPHAPGSLVCELTNSITTPVQCPCKICGRPCTLYACRQAAAAWEAEAKAGLALTAGARGLLLRQRLRRLDQHVRVIQRHWRGHAGRQRFKSARVQHNTVLRKRHFDKAATTIQRHFRGYYSRKYVHSMQTRRQWLQRAMQQSCGAGSADSILSGPSQCTAMALSRTASVAKGLDTGAAAHSALYVWCMRSSAVVFTLRHFCQCICCHAMHALVVHFSRTRSKRCTCARCTPT